MLELERIQTQLKIVSRSITCELDRVKDTLYYLACHSLELFQITPNEPQIIDSWLKANKFGVNEDGFFLSHPDLAAHRAGTLRKDALSYSWPPDKIDDPAARYRLFCHRNMGPMLMTLQQRLPGTVWIYYQDVTNTAIQHPYIDQITAIPPDFQWSSYHTYASVNPEANPERTVCWAPPHIDYAGQGLIIAASVPVYIDDDFIGLWSIDLQVDSLVRPSILAPTHKSQLTCVVQKDGAVIANSEGIDYSNMEKGEEASVRFTDLHAAFAHVDPQELFEIGGDYRLINHDGEDYLLNWANLHCMDWLCVSIIPRNELLDAAEEHFRNAFRNLGRGDRQASVVVDNLPVEMLEIGQAYNEMVDSLDKTREELLREKAKAEAANHAKTLFLANMSHELRTPLNGIMGMHQLLQTTALDDDQEHYVELAVQSADRLTNLLGDILNLTRIEAGKINLTNAPFDLEETLNFSNELFAPSCSQKQISCSFFIHEGVPRRLIGDAIRLQQIINNLIGNAVKFTDQGEIYLEAYPLPSSDDESARILFSISDTGIGIEQSAIEGLFEPFSQAAQGYNRDYQGAGLGLSIVRQLVTLMGGQIDVASKPGRGTVFHFCLPFELQTEAHMASPGQATFASAEAATQRILLVEDDAVSRMATRMLLKKTGYRADAVEDGAEALRALEEKDYSLVLMDIQMPVMDGVEATRAIREGRAGERNARLPIVALTAYAMDEDRQHFLKAGMDDYLAKPVQYDRMAEVISRWLKA